MKLRDTFTLTADGGHLWVVCSLPTEVDGSVVIINMTSWRAGCDEACVVEAGEHPWVRRRTIMKYDLAELVTPTQQMSLKTKGGFRGYPQVAAGLLDRIQRAAILSIHPSRKVQEVIKWSRAKQPQAT